MFLCIIHKVLNKENNFGRFTQVYFHFQLILSFIWDWKSFYKISYHILSCALISESTLAEYCGFLNLNFLVDSFKHLL